jgi:stage V sporulation protein G
MVEVARLYKVDNGSALKAFADVIIGEVLVKGVRIVEGKNGLFAAMPKTQAKDGKWYESVSLTNGELKEKLQETVLEAYTA